MGGSWVKSRGASPFEARKTAARWADSGSTRETIGIATRLKNHEFPEIYENPDTPSRQAAPTETAAALVEAITAGEPAK